MPHRKKESPVKVAHIKWSVPLLEGHREGIVQIA